MQVRMCPQMQHFDTGCGVCMYACMSVYIYICVYVYTYVLPDAYYIYAHTYTFARIYTYHCRASKPIFLPSSLP